MMTVDGYFKQNGRQFVSMEGPDDEMDRMARTPRRSSELVEVTDLYGSARYYFRVHTHTARLRVEDGE